MKLKKIVVAIALVLPAAGAMACASCGCSLNTDIGTQGMGMTKGWTLDVRYDTLNQNKLWSGTKSISQQAVNAANPSAEVENFTQNNYLTGSLDYNDGENWGVTAILPFIMRTHSTFGQGDGTLDGAANASNPAPNGYLSKTSGLGDMKIIGRFFGFAEQKDWGLQLGVKLPTGNNSQTVTNNIGSTQGVDPGLQLGTGSTDIILGAYKFGYLPQTENWGYFANAQYQATIKPTNVPVSIANLNSVDNGGTGGSSYRPGNALNLNLGVNFQGFEKFVPTLQVNYLNKKVDSGTAADTLSTGGNLVYLTPGALYNVTDTTQAYVNLQLPVYQNVNGYQVVPSYIASVGVRVRF
jgi:hypothetical protein